ncbi:hypothetical protein I4U23_027704 [Adineta vaga]|nr:hypothetical protein I4U23_027704 [Adineta vaga]
MSTSPFNRSNSSSMFLNLPSNPSSTNFYNSPYFTNAIRNHFLSPFLLQPLIPPSKPNSLCLSIPHESSSPIMISSPRSTTTTTIQKNHSIDDHDQGSNLSEDGSSDDRDSKRRRTRTNFTSIQIDELERAFQDEINLFFSSISSTSEFSSISPPTNKCSYSIERILCQTLSSNNNLKRKLNNNSSPNKINRIDDGKVPQLS